MQRFLQRISNRVGSLVLRGGLVGCIDGINLRDFENSDVFQSSATKALQLIQAHDPRRYGRIKRHIKWIVNSTTWTMGANYDPGDQACYIDIKDSAPNDDEDIFIAWLSGTLLHEATHGIIAEREIK